MKKSIICKLSEWLGFALFLVLLEQAAAAATLTPVKLTCQGLVNPLGIDAANPVLSWVSITSDPTVRGQVQTAYETIVADTQAGINANTGNIWDSGEVATSQSMQVKYAGAPLQPHQVYYWKVRVWDGNGVVSPWSLPSSWTTGFLPPQNPGANWSNYTVQTQFKLLTTAAGIFFRTTGANNAYMWQVLSSASLKQHVRVNGGYTVLNQISLANILTGNWTASSHQLKVVLNGNVFTTYVDGVLVNTLTNSTFASGGIGFREASGESAVFSSVTVSNLVGQTLYQDNFPLGETNAFTAGTIGTAGGVTGLIVTNADVVFSSPAATTWQPTWIGITNFGSGWNNYTVQAQFQLQKSAAGLLFRTGGDSNAFLCQLTSGAALNICANTNGGYGLLQTVPLTSILTGNWTNAFHQLQVTVSGTVFTTFVDGVQVNTQTNGIFGYGGIGFYEPGGQSAVFSSVTVSNSSGTMLYQDNFTAGESNAFTAGAIGAAGLTVSNAVAVFPNTWLRVPLVRKEFVLPNKTIQRSWIYASALGLYELHLNGQVVGTDLFTPGWTDYRNLVSYQQYDVTSLVQTGTNALGAIVAPGWYSGKVGWFGWDQYGTSPWFAAQLYVQFTDGTTQTVASDTTWKFSSGPLAVADIQDGATYDARQEQAGWDQPGYNVSNWQAVAVSSSSASLVAQVGPPVGVIQTITPVSVSQPSPGLYVYDLGQNITGVVRIRAQGTNGATITLQHAERINSDGTLDMSNLGNPPSKATDVYVMKGTGVETFQPPFTFHGFRYFSVKGLPTAPSLTNVTGVVIGSQVPVTGSLQTSDAMLNQLISNNRWTANNAFMSFPMDSPQRAERLGWTGDANFQSPAAAFNFDMSRFYAKWETDIIDANVPNCAPWIPQTGHAGGGWADVVVNLPWLVWQRYGDTNIIANSYAGMKSFLSWLQSNSANYDVNASISAAGDWVGLESTSQNLLGTAFFAYDAQQMSQMAAAIGQTADAATYQTLFLNISNAFCTNWVAADGTVGTGSQTAYVLALHAGLLPTNLRSNAMQKLAANITAHSNHLTTGYVGTQWLLFELANNGRPDLAYAVLQQTTYPGWLYEVGMNQTTLWECWSSLNANGTFAASRTSLDHSALGSVGNWMYQAIGGLVPDAAHPAFKHFFIAPLPGGTLNQAAATLQSPQGLISSSWTWTNQQFNLTAEVPVNSTATILLPTTNTASITESGLTPSAANGVVFAGITNGAASYNVGSGRYYFATTLTNSQSAGTLLAADNQVTTTPGQPVTINVLANDSGPGLLGVQSVTSPGYGWAAIQSGAVVYTPAPGFVGNDRFNYVVTNSTQTAIATVFVAVQPAWDGTLNGAQLAVTLANGHTQITYLQLRNSSLKYAVQVSNDLIHWTSGPGVTQTISQTILDDNWQAVTATGLDNPATNACQFIRLSVSQ